MGGADHRVYMMKAKAIYNLCFIYKLIIGFFQIYCYFKKLPMLKIFNFFVCDFSKFYIHLDVSYLSSYKKNLYFFLWIQQPQKYNLFIFFVLFSFFVVSHLLFSLWTCFVIGVVTTVANSWCFFIYKLSKILYIGGWWNYY